MADVLMGARMNTRALIVINGDDVYEDLFGASLELQGIMTDAGFVTDLRMGMGAFTGSVETLEELDMVVLYTAMGEFNIEQQRGLAAAVDGGMGLIAIHASNVFGSDNGHIADEYLTAFDLLGGRYASHGPPPHESRFTVALDCEHPITRGIGPFAITHEHYHLEQADAHNQVLAWRPNEGGREPLVYVREHGRGRVCYLQFGHDMRAWNEPAIRTMIGNAANWAQRKDSIIREDSAIREGSIA
jgi:type 1 glutamine amidotransferase